MNSRSNRSEWGSNRVKLVAVMLTAALLLSLGAAGLRHVDEGKRAARSKAEALFDEARAAAIGKPTTARVLVDGSGLQEIPASR